MDQPQVMTVLGSLPPAELGATDAHEHLFLRSPALPGDELDDLDRALAEVGEGRETGLGAIVELTPIGLGRRPDLLRQVSAATGLHVIAASGYHRDAHYADDHWLHSAPSETLVECIVTDITRGMHPSDWDDPAQPLDEARAGVIKAGASYEQITDSERRRLQAALEASRQTGAPVVVHTEAGTCGAQIVELMLGAGLPAHRLTLAHMDRNPEPALHAEICSAGVTLVYDTPGRTRYGPDSARVELITRMVEAGHGTQLMLGLDLGRREYFRSYGGGPGMRHLLADFAPRLVERVGHAMVRQLLVDNPARAFALLPVAESVR